MRKVIQISVAAAPATEQFSGFVVTTSLCDDGTMWELLSDNGKWTQLPPIPQPEIADEVVMPPAKL